MVVGPIEFEPHVSADVADDAPAVSDAVDQTQAPTSGGVGWTHRHPDAGPAVDHLDANRVIGHVGAEADSLPRAQSGVAHAVCDELAGQQEHGFAFGLLKRELCQRGPHGRWRRYTGRQAQFEHRHSISYTRAPVRPVPDRWAPASV